MVRTRLIRLVVFGFSYPASCVIAFAVPWIHFLFSWRQVDTCSIVSEHPERFGHCQAHVGSASCLDPILLYRL